MAVFAKFSPFVEKLAEKVFNLGSDQLKVALTNTAPNSANAVLSDITEIAYTNLSSRNVTTTSSAQAAGTYKLVCADLVLTSSGGTTGPFRYVVLFSDTAASDDLIGFYDHGSAVTLGNSETFTCNFDNVAGVLTLA